MTNGKPTDGWTMLLPPGWARFPTGEGRARELDAAIEQVIARALPDSMPRDKAEPYRHMLRDELHKTLGESQEAGTGAVYLPTEPMDGVLVPATIAEVEVVSDVGQDPLRVVTSILTGGYEQSDPAEVDGRPAVRVVQTKHKMRRDPDWPEVSTRQVLYVVSRDEAAGGVAGPLLQHALEQREDRAARRGPGPLLRRDHDHLPLGRPRRDPLNLPANGPSPAPREPGPPPDAPPDPTDATHLKTEQLCTTPTASPRHSLRRPVHGRRRGRRRDSRATRRRASALPSSRADEAPRSKGREGQVLRHEDQAERGAGVPLPDRAAIPGRRQPVQGDLRAEQGPRPARRRHPDRREHRAAGLGHAAARRRRGRGHRGRRAADRTWPDGEAARTTRPRPRRRCRTT